MAQPAEAAPGLPRASSRPPRLRRRVPGCARRHRPLDLADRPRRRGRLHALARRIQRTAARPRHRRRDERGMVPAERARRAARGRRQTTARSDARQPSAPAARSACATSRPRPRNGLRRRSSARWSSTPSNARRSRSSRPRSAKRRCRIRAACRDEASPSSAERLRAHAEHALGGARRGDPASRAAGEILRLAHRRAAPEVRGAGVRAGRPALDDAGGASAGFAARRSRAKAMLRQAEQSLNLNRAQRASLDAFQKKSAEMGQFLMASCLQAGRRHAGRAHRRGGRPADRADLSRPSTVNLALNDFHNQLNDDQKGRSSTAAVAPSRPRWYAVTSRT